MLKADLAHIDTWIFDLDQTLYPPEAEVMALIEGKMTAYVSRHTGLVYAEAYALQKSYLAEHGTTLAGMMANHGIDPYSFLNEVHDVSLDNLHPDPELNAQISSLKGRKIVFTNGDEPHALRILAHLEMTDLFDGLFHLSHADLIPKPNLTTYERFIRAHDITPTQAAFFEDSPKNLKPAKALGMTTILVGPKAVGNEDDFVDYRAESVKSFLKSIL